jgi:AcrR family transcriptional regulator
MRDRLLEAALELFGAQGYEATTIDQIAARADVARQTVLNHYPHKRDFVAEWGSRRRDRLVALPGGTARQRLHRYFDALAEMNERQRDLTRMLYLTFSSAESSVHQRPVPDATVAAIRAGQADGDFDATIDPDLAAQVVAAIYFDTLSRWLTSEPSFDLGAVLHAKLDLVLAGLNAS